MTLDEFVRAAWDARQALPERPSPQQWDDFFSQMQVLSPQGGLLEAYQLERDLQAAQ